jgi:hypothetical protein
MHRSTPQPIADAHGAKAHTRLLTASYTRFKRRGTLMNTEGLSSLMSSKISFVSPVGPATMAFFFKKSCAGLDADLQADRHTMLPARLAMGNWVQSVLGYGAAAR